MPHSEGAYRRAAPGALFVALLFVLVAGVFAMHGLGTHGSSSTGQTAVTSASGPMAADHQASVAGSTLEIATRPVTVAAVGDGGMAMAELCVAVLVGLGFALLLVEGLRRRTAISPPRLRQWRVRLPDARDRDPPSSSLLSVLRC